MKFNFIIVLIASLFTISDAKINTNLSDIKQKQENADKKSDADSNPANVLTGDFLTGFETGIFLKNSKDQVDEYGCPKAAIKIEEFRKIKDLMPNVAQIIKTLNNNDEEMGNMFESLTVFMDHLDELIGVFDYGYNGGDFCAGLTFGFSGSNLLYNIAEAVISHHVKNKQ